MPAESPDYAGQLRAAVSGYQGRRERSVRRAGDIFEFFALLYADRRLSRAERTVVSAVLAYFVVRDDFLPDEESQVRATIRRALR